MLAPSRRGEPKAAVGAQRFVGQLYTAARVPARGRAVAAAAFGPDGRVLYMLGERRPALGVLALPGLQARPCAALPG